ncbi:MAG: 50S ribosomal protein L32 [Deltaproteobacteria bacterium]|jgi:large subunit ribosomal protein L32|nr:50S ribosomal protein L32 [Deltaproteobacteria bacterium]
MAVPKKKPSRSRRGNRRSHDALSLQSLVLCPQCDTPKLPHRVCPNCGTYRGKVFIQKSE